MLKNLKTIKTSKDAIFHLFEKIDEKIEILISEIQDLKICLLQEVEKEESQKNEEN